MSNNPKTTINDTQQLTSRGRESWLRKVRRRKVGAVIQAKMLYYSYCNVQSQPSHVLVLLSLYKIPSMNPVHRIRISILKAGYLPSAHYPRTPPIHCPLIPCLSLFRSLSFDAKAPTRRQEEESLSLRGGERARQEEKQNQQQIPTSAH
eukprot:781890-Rhodomonas_salina.1